MMKKIIFVTGNENKLREARQILSGYDIDSRKLDLPELQGSRASIAKDKAKKACDELGMTVVVEDTSLCFNALDELPGPYIKDFLLTLGPERLVRLLDGFPDKSAKAVVTIGFCEPGKEPLTFEGCVNGAIVPPKGASGFGWDVIFQPDGYTQTYAEMGAEEKNKISHRMKGFLKLRDYLSQKDD